MDLNKVIKMAKGDEEEKVGISLKLPISLKTQLQEVADKNHVSVNAFVNSLIDYAINNDTPSEKDLYLELNDLEKNLSSSLLSEDEGGELFCGLYCNPGVIDYDRDSLESLIYRVRSLRKSVGA